MPSNFTDKMEEAFRRRRSGGATKRNNKRVKKKGANKKKFCKKSHSGYNSTGEEHKFSNRLKIDTKLINKARENLVKQAKREGIKLRQTYVRKGKAEAFRGGRYFHAKQFKRGRRSVSKQKTWLGRVMRDIGRKSPEVT